MRSNVTPIVTLSLLVAGSLLVVNTAGCSSADVGATGEPTATGSGGESVTVGETGAGSSGGGSLTSPTEVDLTTGESGVTTGPLTASDSATDTDEPPETSMGMDTTGGLETTGDGESGSETGAPPPDGDMDGTPDADDNCPLVENPDQADADADGIGDACEDDDDDDDDGILDVDDNCPLVPNEMQQDLDKDGIGDFCDDDKDGDTVPNDDDNCPIDMNQDQKDQDQDTVGDVCDNDDDGDSIPDEADVFPNDKMEPGVVIPKKIYAHSSSALSTVDVVDYTVVPIGNFQWPNGNDSMTDIAIDRYGVLYGVSFGRAYVCNPATAKCFNLGTLNNSYNGLTWIPAGIIEQDKDSLIGIAQNGSWNHLTFNNNVVSAQQLGSYGAGYTSAGDAFSIENVGTFAAVNKQGSPSTVIVTVDPLTGKVLNELAVTQGYNSVYGLAGWEGLILAFDSSGTVIKIDPMTKVVTNLGKKAQSWWGAGVGTILPQ